MRVKDILLKGQIKGLEMRYCVLGAESLGLISERLVETKHKVSSVCGLT